MANLIIVSGPQAVGKMTVAEALRDKIGYRLMTNHDSIELSDVIFERGSSAQEKLNKRIREAVFELAIENDINMIFTYVMAYGEPKEIDYIARLKRQFEDTGGTFYFVELSTDLETRLQRNITQHRLERKPSKKDTERTKNEILETSKKYRFNSYEDEYVCENHLKIDNTNLTPEEVADIIMERFDLISQRGK